MKNENKKYITSNRKIAKNTLMLYIRQILVLFISLYSVRMVLLILGVEDYGIYSAVGGIVTFFSFLSGAMASATQRFFSFALGQNDLLRLRKTFSINIIIYIMIAIVAVILLESVGLWFINNKLNVPPDRFNSVSSLFQISIITFIMTIISTPLMAIIVAHENMELYAYISILEAVLKLFVVLLLRFINFDKLLLYGLLLLSVSFINSIIYIIVCYKKYDECQFKAFYWDSILFKEILNFTGWTLFGQLTSVIRNQAVTLLLNQKFNPVVVAARAIAVNVSNYVNVFANNFNLGLYPPIIKEYASDNKQKVYELLYNGSKMTFFLMWIFGLPLFFKMEFVLTLWLKVPPKNAILFTQLGLLEVLIMSISLPLTTVARAPGKMKSYELTLGIIQILIFIVDIVLLSFGAEAYWVFVIAIIGNLFMFVFRLMIVKKLVFLPIKQYTNMVLLPIFIVIVITTMFSFYINKFIGDGFVSVFFFILLSTLFTIIIMYFVGLDKYMKNKIKLKIIRIMDRLWKF